MRAGATRSGIPDKRKPARHDRAAVTGIAAAPRMQAMEAAASPISPDALRVLVLNSGSSSLKFGLYRVAGSEPALLLGGAATSMGQGDGRFEAADGQGRPLACERARLADPGAAVDRIRRLLDASAVPTPQAIGFRIVHGGPRLRAHCRIDESVLEQLAQAAAFAPLHTPVSLAVVRAARALFPGLPGVACFDTSFHARMPERAACLPLPAALRDQGLRRYGFHGLSCESIVHQLAGRLPRRLLIAHLGSGASVTAVLDGVSIDTSMGLTPSGGLVMGTRCGDLDPGVLVHLMRERGFGAAELEELVDRQGGLAGISGLDGDLRSLHAAAAAQPAARLAIEVFCYRAAKELAGMAVALGGAELLVFTGGIGENDAAVRAAICGRLACIGVRTEGGGGCGVMVLPSQEDAQIARHAWALR
jgi:acetate kinase